MNKIVMDHYPVSKLPDDIRSKLAATTDQVRVTIEASEPTSPFAYAFGDVQNSARTTDNTVALIAEYRKNPDHFSGGVTLDEAAKRIRELRDEWED